MAQRRGRPIEIDDEIIELQRRLDEAEETLRAIRQGEVDALVVDGPHGEMIYTLTSADYPYRLIYPLQQPKLCGNPRLIRIKHEWFPVWRLHCSGHARPVYGRLGKGTRAGRSPRIQAPERRRKRSSGADVVCKTPTTDKLNQYCRH